jgi:general secretion pathway protein B
MSYILEALKKAQAERQLGTAPTIHALPLYAAPVADAGVRRKPVWIALGVGALAIAAVVVWRLPSLWTPAAVAAAAVPGPTPVAPSQAVELARTPPAPVQRVPRPAVAHSAPTPGAIKPAPAPARPAVPDDGVHSLRQLPESIQREVPSLAIGGYMYSKDPADRLLLIDKVLRREGEEIAPGLTLEKLQPKSMVLNYKGYRYRVVF